MNHIAPRKGHNQAPRGNPERAVQVAVIRWMRLVLPEGSIVAAAVNESRAASADPNARARYYAARRTAGVVTGFPDLVIALPGCVLFAEVKRPDGGVVSWQQAQVHRALAALGHCVGIVTSIETARWWLHNMGIPLREAPGQPEVAPKVRYETAPAIGASDEVPF